MKQLITFLLGLIFIITSCTQNSKKSNALPFLLKTPNNLNDSLLYPLIVCFHGAGGRGTDNIGTGSMAFNRLKRLIDNEKYKSFLFMAQCPENEQWVDTPWKDGNYSMSNIEISNELEWVNNKIDSIIRNYQVDPNRIYITGMSMGGFATWDMILRFPDKYACAIPICGGGDTAYAKNLKNLPIWIFHGEKDKIVPVASSREMYKCLSNISEVVRYTEFDSTGHDAWTKAWEKEMLIDWMFKQKSTHNNTPKNQ